MIRNYCCFSSCLCRERSKGQRMFIDGIWTVLAISAGVMVALGQTGQDQIYHLELSVFLAAKFVVFKFIFSSRKLLAGKFSFALSD